MKEETMRKLDKVIDELYSDTYLVEKDDKLIRFKRTKVCDFCETELGDSCWTYPCGLVELPHVDDPTGLPCVSDDPWACCNACHRFIAAKDWTGLAKRGLDLSIVRSQIALLPLDELYLQSIEAMIEHFKRFDAARTGDPYQEQYPYSEH